MRIGYFIPGWPPGSFANGIVTTLGHLGQELRNLGHDVFFLTPSLGIPSNDIRVVRIPQMRRTLLGKLRLKMNMESELFKEISNDIAESVNSLIRKERLHIFQMEETQGWIARAIVRAPVPLVVRLHGPWFMNRDLGTQRYERPHNRNRVEREGKAIVAAAALTAPSHDILTRTQDYYHFVKSFTKVIPNPIYVQPVERRWSLLNCDRGLILFVGRFDRIKGADVLLRGFKRLASIHASLRLVFVGPDIGLVNEHNEPMHFEQFCMKELGSTFRERISFLGQLQRSQIEELRQRAYVTVVASRYETFGNVVIEAMAAGAPLVATKTGGIAEILVHGRNALLAEPGDDEDLASCIQLLVKNPELAEHLGQQAIADCSKRYNPRKIAQSTVEFYGRVLHGAEI